MTKIYCDTADIKIIKKCIKMYNVDGVTTNPSIMRATGVKNYKSQCLKILKIYKLKLQKVITSFISKIGIENNLENTKKD